MADITVRIPAIEQLLQLAASGVGSVAGPLLASWQARQHAKAKRIEAATDADVLQIQAQAQAEARKALVPSDAQASTALDIGNMIMQRVQFQEEKRHANIGSVVSQAADLVQDNEVDSTEPDHDWTARFFNEVQDVSSEVMQALWARVLAGEVERKGSTSVHTLNVLRNLDQHTAAQFKKLCSNCIYFIGRQIPGTDARMPSMGGDPGSNALSKYGFSYENLNRLQEHGLIVADYNTRMLYKAGSKGAEFRPPFEFQDSTWTLNGDTDWDFQISGIALSVAGREMAAVIDLEPSKEYKLALEAFFQKHGLSMVHAPVFVSA